MQCSSAAGASSFMEHSSWFGALSAIGLVTSFSSTLMFTALGSFFNRISDPGEQAAAARRSSSLMQRQLGAGDVHVAVIVLQPHQRSMCIGFARRS
jgi:hypothetical protein